MWKCMLDCHHNQLLAIKEARNLDALVDHKKPSHSNLELTNQLVHDLCAWTFEFSSWVSTQRKFIQSLNAWLLKCLLYEPDNDAPDGPAPFSPGRLGAPSIFVICHQWSQAFDRISEKEVIASMRGLTLCVRQFWEQDKSVLRQSMDSMKALESKVRELDREDQKMQKELQALDKKLIVASGSAGLLSLSDQAVYQSDTSNASLKNSLQLVFDSMERFTATSMKEYEELLQRIEEDKLAQQSAKAS